MKQTPLANKLKTGFKLMPNGNQIETTEGQPHPFICHHRPGFYDTHTHIMIAQETVAYSYGARVRYLCEHCLNEMILFVRAHEQN